MERHYRLEAVHHESPKSSVTCYSSGMGELSTFTDPRAIPNYGIPEAAHYLRMPVTTLRAWLLGQDYETLAGKKRFKPTIKLAQRKPPLLSFFHQFG